MVVKARYTDCGAYAFKESDVVPRLESTVLVELEELYDSMSSSLLDFFFVFLAGADQKSGLSNRVSLPRDSLLPLAWSKLRL